tara:strand:+ start:640 stop:984 length:345 start_codon:yes stop_codon:yes gene_type:complete
MDPGANISEEASNSEETVSDDELDWEEKLGFRVVEDGDFMCTRETKDRAIACKIAIEQFYENFFRAYRERNQRYILVVFGYLFSFHIIEIQFHFCLEIKTVGAVNLRRIARGVI